MVPACSGQCADPGHMPHIPPRPEHRLGRKDLLLVEGVGSEEGNQRPGRGLRATTFLYSQSNLWKKDIVVVVVM